MRVFLIATAAVTVALLAVRPAQSQAIPDLNVDPVCHEIAHQAANPSEQGGPDLAFSQCGTKRAGDAAKTPQRMVDVLADGKIQLHRCGKRRNGELYRSRQTAWKWRKTRGSPIRASKRQVIDPATSVAV